MKYARYTVVGIASGLLFGAMDGLANGNPLAVELYRVYEPIARSSVNISAGIVIDVMYGFVLAALFILLYPGLPGATGWLKGIGYGLIIWFLRTVMGAASSWMMFDINIPAILYTVVSGLAEMLVLGAFYGLTLKPGQDSP